MESFKLDKSKFPIYVTRESKKELDELKSRIECKCTCHPNKAFCFTECCSKICPCNLEAGNQATKKDIDRHHELCYTYQQSINNPKGRHKLK